MLANGRYPGKLREQARSYNNSDTSLAGLTEQHYGECRALCFLLTGNLSHQIEYHLFPDLPALTQVPVSPALTQQAVNSCSLKQVRRPRSPFARVRRTFANGRAP